MFALALRIGCTVEELGQRMSAVEFREWADYADAGDPWFDLAAEQKQDLRTGVIGATLANLLGGGRRKHLPSDFAPRWSSGGPARRQSGEDMKRAAMRWAAAMQQRK